MIQFLLKRIDISEFAVEYKRYKNEYYFKGFIIIYDEGVQILEGLSKFYKRGYPDIHTYVNKVEELKNDDK